MVKYKNHCGQSENKAVDDFVKVAVYHQIPAVIPSESLTLPTGSIVFKISSEPTETHDSTHRDILQYQHKGHLIMCW